MFPYGKRLVTLQAIRSTARSSERDHELAAARFDTGGDREFRRQPAEPIDQPISGLIGVSAARAQGYDFASALTSQPLGDTDERSRLGDEQPRRPWHHCLDRASAGVAPAVGQTFSHAALALGGFGGHQPIDARPAAIVHRHLRIDRLVAELAPPAVPLSNLVEAAHRAAARTEAVVTTPR
jgi:hypothetical protein